MQGVIPFVNIIVHADNLGLPYDIKHMNFHELYLASFRTIIIDQFS